MTAALGPRRGLACGVAAIGAIVALAGPAAAQGAALDSAGPGTAVGLWMARLVNHLGLAATVGALLVPAWLLAPGQEPSARRAASRLAALAAIVWALSAAAALVFGLSNAVARPLPEALTGPLVARFVATRFGAAVALQGLAALTVAGLAAVARNRAGSRLALGLALVGATGAAWWGHANTADPRLLALGVDWLHIVAASAWVGGLLAVVVLLLRRAPLDPFAPIGRYSHLAGWAILVVAVTGLTNTALHTGDLSQLVDTTWGRLALGKALVLLVLASLGWAHRRRTIPRLRARGSGGAARALFLRIAAVELVIMVGAFGLATTMASGVPANVEASARIQQIVVPLGDGLVELSLDPARTGRNEIHLYVYDEDRALRPIDDAAITLRLGDVVAEPRLVPTGPGHYTGPAVQLPVPGTYRVTLEVGFKGAVDTATGALTVR